MIRGILGKTTIGSEYLQSIISKDYTIKNPSMGIDSEISYVKVDLDFPNFPAIDTDSNLQNFSYKGFLEEQFRQTVPPRTLSNDKLMELKQKRRDFASLVQASEHEEVMMHENIQQSMFVKNIQDNSPQKKKIFEPEEASFNPFEKENSKEYQFMEITNCQDFNIVKKYLKSANNDVQVAITNYFQANGYSH